MNRKAISYSNLLLMMLAAAGFDVSLSAQILCPDCVKTVGALQPDAEHGYCGSRRYVNVCVGGNWGSDSGTVSNALYDAANMWNTARGAQGSTDAIPFVLQLRSSDCDIIVNKSSSVSCAEANSPASPITVSNSATVDVNIAALTSGNLTSILAHELGHPLGLPNANPYSSCASRTIMSAIIQGPADTTCQGTFQQSQIQAGDVDSVQRKFENSSSCYFTATSAHLPECDFDDCYDWVDQWTDQVSTGGDCFDVYEVTDYYWCAGGTSSCAYLGSTYQYLYTDCFVWGD